MSAADVTTRFREALSGLDDAVRRGGDPTEALRTLDALLTGPRPSPEVLRELLDAVAGLGATWVSASGPLLDQARQQAQAADTPDLADVLLHHTREQVRDAALDGELQQAVDVLFLGGAFAQRAGAHPDALLPLLARLEATFGEEAVETALDRAWGGALA